MVRSPGAGGSLGIDAQGLFARRFGVVEGEIVEVFLDTDGAGVNTAGCCGAAAHVRVGGAVGIYGEAGYGLIGRLDEGILHDQVEMVPGGRIISGRHDVAGTIITRMLAEVSMVSVFEHCCTAAEAGGQKEE